MSRTTQAPPKMAIQKIAHDMRTPLSAIIWTISSAINAKKLMDAKADLKVAARNARTLAAIVERLIETGSGKPPRLDFEECMPLDLVKAALDQVVPIAKGKQIRMDSKELSVLPAIMADRIGVTRVLVNLLSNAIRFSPKHGKILVSAKTRANDGRVATVFSVSDEGPGIPLRNIGKIFIAGRSFGRPSTGLGLSVCEEIVEAHGGHIWLEEQHGKGAVFAFSIPKLFL